MDDFYRFCEEIGCEPTDERRVFWVAALQTTRQQQPVVYAAIGKSGEVLGLFDAVPAEFIKEIVPLYQCPVSDITKPPIQEQLIHLAWRNYEGDYVGFARWIEKMTKKET